KEHGKIKGTYEVGVKAVKLIASVSQEYPLSAKKLAGDVFGTDFLMDHRHLWLRAPRQAAILKVRHTIIKAVRDFFDERGFVLVDGPIFTPNAC
ncbi:amino acid--tRNA ligase-related protein, partial [Clostridium perfringens]|uniref:amino acid--tRNA ligase-related protein n=1 Tax=Clostridium perfringens TaxID=1502 RepID=UPI003754192A